MLILGVLCVFLVFLYKLKKDFHAYYELIFLGKKYIFAYKRFLHVCYRAVLDKMPKDLFLSIHLPMINIEKININKILPLHLLLLAFFAHLGWNLPT